MKSLHYLLMLLCGCALSLAALDWQPRPASQLREETAVALRQFSTDFAASRGAAAAALALQAKMVREAETSPDNWIGDVLDFVVAQQQQYPPDDPANAAIREALQRIWDYPVHVDTRQTDPQLSERWSREINRVYRGRLTESIEAIGADRVRDGVKIYKLYNMGFVVKSANHTIGFDFMAGPLPPRKLSDRELQILGATLDMLLVSHWHGDHFTMALIDEMLRRGKPVIIPAPGRLADRGESSAAVVYGATREFGKIQVTALPGKQDRDRNSVYLVSFDGYTISHNGDNFRMEKIYAEIPRQVKRVDVALTNCWSGLRDFALAAPTGLVITGHENELSHPVKHRESFRETYTRLGDRATLPPHRILNDGEVTQYTRK